MVTVKASGEGSDPFTIIGRWWALAAPTALGLWAGLTFTDLEVPAPWIAFAGMGALGVLIGLLVRRLAFRAVR